VLISICRHWCVTSSWNYGLPADRLFTVLFTRSPAGCRQACAALAGRAVYTDLILCRAVSQRSARIVDAWCVVGERWVFAVEMYAKGKGSTAPSDAQAREKWVRADLVRCSFANVTLVSSRCLITSDLIVLWPPGACVKWHQLFGAFLLCDRCCEFIYVREISAVTVLVISEIFRRRVISLNWFCIR